MKIAILGTENSHAQAFAKLIHEQPKYRDVEIIGVYGYDDAANQRLLSQGLVPCAAQRPDDFLGRVDGVMVTARHGDLHPAYALPYLRAGVPAFLDKPLTVSLEKMEEMMRFARENHTPVCGGSSLKYMDEFRPLRRFLEKGTPLGGYVTAPVNMRNEYGGFYFYAQHLVECLFSIFGGGVRAVCARCPDEQKNRISLLMDYGDYDVTAQYSDTYTYAASVLTKEGFLSASVGDVSYCYERELDAFLEMVKTGRMPETYEELEKPARLLHVIEQAYQTQKEVQVAW